MEAICVVSVDRYMGVFQTLVMGAIPIRRSNFDSLNTRMEVTVSYHNTLNPALWDGMNLKPEVRQSLFRIAQAFIKYLGSDLAPHDILLIGSSANYNWNAKSDIDLQIIAPLHNEMEKELFDTKKKVFKRDYDLTVKGLSVEVTVSSSVPPVESAYSIMTDQWVKEPEFVEPQFDKEKAESLATSWAKKIKEDQGCDW